MIEICPKKDCTGCFACLNICGFSAITVGKDANGFYVPQIHQDKCTDCNACLTVCPALKPVNKREPFGKYAYASWSKDESIRRGSSSGGFFPIIAKYILKENGVVFGAGFDENLTVCHQEIEQVSDIKKLIGSKYVQSNIGSSFGRVKHFLKEGRLVLFVGTPCQIGGLRKYLRKDYERLYTIDLVCHGVPSPLVFDKYKKWLEDTYKSKITEYNFRDKHKSWMWFNAKAVFESGDTYIGTWFADPFMRIFLRDFSLKDCCYNCQYTNMNRVGDLTIADFWGYKSTSSKDRNTDKGISLIIVNSQKGEAMFKKTEADLTSFKRDVEVISKGQRSFSMPFSRPEEADSYWNFLHTESFERVIAKYGYPQKRNIAQYALSEFGHNRLTGAIVWGYWKWRGIRRRIKRIF